MKYKKDLEKLLYCIDGYISDYFMKSTKMLISIFHLIINTLSPLSVNMKVSTSVLVLVDNQMTSIVLKLVQVIKRQ